VADRGGPIGEVEVGDLERDDLAGAHPGLEHQPDQGLVAAMPQRLGRRLVLPHRARLKQRLEVGVGERLDDPLVDLGRLDAEERVGGDLTLLGEPRGEPAHRELSGTRGRRGGAAVEESGNPQLRLDRVSGGTSSSAHHLR
jgi:hypothetical protein